LLKIEAVVGHTHVALRSATPSDAELAAADRLEGFCALATLPADAGHEPAAEATAAVAAQRREACRLLKALAAVLEEDRDLRAWEIEPLEDVRCAAPDTNAAHAALGAAQWDVCT
jgi:hypothetical protein